MNSKVGKYIETDFIHICEGEICFPYVALKLNCLYSQAYNNYYNNNTNQFVY